MCWRSYPLSIRFNGVWPLRGVPICELSTTLAAVQRMVCRAYILVKKEQARQGEDPAARTGMSQGERLQYALRLAARDWSSRTFYLDWFYNGPVEAALVKQREKVLVLLHQVFSLYKESKVEFKPKELGGKLALLLYNDVYEVANRIGQVGGIQSIEIRPFKMQPCMIDKSVDDYVDSLFGKTYDGEIEELSAVVVAPRTSNRSSATVKSDTHQVKLITQDKGFTHKLLDKILEVLAEYPDPQDQPCFRFPGTQRFRIGHDPDQYPEFVLQTPVSLIQYATPSGQTGAIRM